MQLRPIYPTKKQAERAREQTKKKLQQFAHERKALFQETESRSVNISFDKYRLFLKGYSYDDIWHKQMDEEYEDRWRYYMREQEKYEEKCRWKDYIRERHR